MSKKLLLISLLAVLMLVSLSFISSALVIKDFERKESPLYQIRTKKTISENVEEIVNKLNARFLGERIFFLPFVRIRYTPQHSEYKAASCDYTMCLAFCFKEIATENNACNPLLNYFLDQKRG